MIKLNYDDLKDYLTIDNVNRYIDTTTKYIVISQVGNFDIYCEIRKNDTTNKNDFENNYKDENLWSGNERVRTTNCKIGRNLHARYINLTTADQDNYDNTDWEDNDFNDITYIMKDSNGDTTTTNAQAKETWLDFEPSWNYEVCGGKLFVPSTLAGSNDDAWEIHVVGVPDISAQNGGSISFIANPRIKWLKGNIVEVDSTTNPAEMVYNATYHTNKIRFCFKHPVGAQSEFQLKITCYK